MALAVRSALLDLRPVDSGSSEGAELIARTSAWARAALDAGLLNVPPPGRGRTAERISALADVGSVDLDLGRLAEAHTDVQAILADLAGTGDVADSPHGEADAPGSPGLDPSGLWGVWAANPPFDPLTAELRSRVGFFDIEGWILRGAKPWCNGAGCVDKALVTAKTPEGYRLFAVGMSHPGATPVPGTWPAAAMRGSDSRSVRFDAVPATAVGGPGDYLSRAGFWHGAVGVAAAWWGGARGVAEDLRRAHRRRPLHAHALAHAGAIDAALSATWSQLMAAAAAFDDDPEDKAETARLTAVRVRAFIERAATETIERTDRALGAAPLALDAEHGRRVADLALYPRQSHAERDLEELGRSALESGVAPWDGTP